MKLFMAVVLVWGIVCVGLVIKIAGFGINFTESMPKGVYLEHEAAAKRGDVVTFCLRDDEYIALAEEREYLSAGSCPSGLRPLLKYLAGVPGDVITIEQDAIICGPQNGIRCRWSGKIRQTDSADRPLQSQLQSCVIPPNMALVLSLHPGSFDSRYFGLVNVGSLTHVKHIPFN